MSNGLRETWNNKRRRPLCLERKSTPRELVSRSAERRGSGSLFYASISYLITCFHQNYWILLSCSLSASFQPLVFHYSHSPTENISQNMYSSISLQLSLMNHNHIITTILFIQSNYYQIFQSNPIFIYSIQFSSFLNKIPLQWFVFDSVSISNS